MSYEFSINVSATSANLGACFDFAGVPVPGLFNTVEADLSPNGNSITIDGYGKGLLPEDESNLIFKAFFRTFEYAGLPCPTVNIHCINRIPPNSGLGSSAAAALGGIFLANKIMGNRLSNDQMLDIACEFEGHPDNAAPVIFGGAVITAQVGDKRVAIPIKLAKDLYLAVAVPDIRLPTAVSRSVLPAEYSRADLVKAMSTAALVVDALKSGDYPLMGKLMMQDVVHIPYRKSLIKGYDDVVTLAMESGACGCMISGAGSTMVSFCTDEATAARVADAMVAGFGKNGVKAFGVHSAIKAE